jgi:hypothetical protein
MFGLAAPIRFWGRGHTPVASDFRLGRSGHLHGLPRISVLNYLPFTNPSVPPDWIGGPERYRLIALEDAGRVCDLITESAHKLE